MVPTDIIHSSGRCLRFCRLLLLLLQCFAPRNLVGKTLLRSIARCICSFLVVHDEVKAGPPAKSFLLLSGTIDEIGQTLPGASSFFR